jgi:hypothetical protein
MSYLTGGIEWDVPKPFDGSAEDAQSNFDSHTWVQEDEFTVVCSVCDSKNWHVAANYPCGTEPPRTTIVQYPR